MASEHSVCRARSGITEFQYSWGLSKPLTSTTVGEPSPYVKQWSLRPPTSIIFSIPGVEISEIPLRSSGDPVPACELERRSEPEQARFAATVQPKIASYQVVLSHISISLESTLDPTLATLGEILLGVVDELVCTERAGLITARLPKKANHDVSLPPSPRNLCVNCFRGEIFNGR